MSGDVAERAVGVDVGSEPLLSVLLLERLLPKGRRELEHTALRPARQQAEEIPQVGPRLEAVHLTAGQERDEGGVDLRTLVAAHENPVFSSDGLSAQLALRDVVMDREPAVLEEALERLPLVPPLTPP